VGCEECETKWHKKCTGDRRKAADEAAKSGRWRCEGCEGRTEAEMDDGTEEKARGREAEGPEEEGTRSRGGAQKGCCERCRKPIRAGTQPVSCEGCGKKWHKKCTGASRKAADEAAKSGRWRCEGCEGRTEEEEDRPEGRESQGKEEGLEDEERRTEGGAQKERCKRCRKPIRAGTQPVRCEGCEKKWHKKCTGASRKAADEAAKSGRWRCEG
jgi:hypothetical protein